MQVSFKPIIHLHRQRKDKKYSVIIRIGFKSKYVFLETDYAIDKTDLNKKGDIKNRNIIDKCNILIAKYREITDNMVDIKSFNVAEIKQKIENYLSSKKSLCFMEFFSDFLKDSKQSPSLAIYNATYKHLIQFSGENIPVTSITPKFLIDFEKYLSDKMGSRGVNMYLSTVRKIYNLIMDEYEYKGYEFRYPFRKYKIPKAKYSKTTSLTKEQLIAIIDVDIKGIVPNRARDLFVISLLTLGTNAKDLYLLDKISDRIEYNRSKTKNKREDEAFISVKIEPKSEETKQKTGKRNADRTNCLRILQTTKRN